MWGCPFYPAGAAPVRAAKGTPVQDVSADTVLRAEQAYGRAAEMQVAQEILPWELDLIERVCGDNRFHDAVVFTEAAGSLALIHKPSDPAGAFWAVTGGLEPGEELADAVERETYEETGLHVRPLSYVLRLTAVFTAGGRRRPWTSHVFLAGLDRTAHPVDSGTAEGAGLPDPSPVDTHEVETAEWVTRERFCKEVVPVLAASGWGRFAYRLTLTRLLFRELGWEGWE